VCGVATAFRRAADDSAHRANAVAAWFTRETERFAAETHVAGAFAQWVSHSVQVGNDFTEVAG